MGNHNLVYECVGTPLVLCFRFAARIHFGWMEERNEPSLMRNCKELTPKFITECCDKGDELAIEVYRRTGFILGIGLANYASVFDPEAIILTGGISKAGNSHLRCILIEAAQSICRGKIGYKSKELRSRQQGNTAEVIAYADKANQRLRKKYYKMIFKKKKHNVAVTAIARELACFVWGMMTNNIDFKIA